HAAHNFNDICNSVFAEQHAAECALLGEQVMGRGSFALPCLACFTGES
ncbi:MAG: hypothetical protein ACJAS7_000502, partial [Alpinimonas sp.]